MRFTVRKLSISVNRPCRSDRCPKDTNELVCITVRWACDTTYIIYAKTKVSSIKTIFSIREDNISHGYCCVDMLDNSFEFPSIIRIKGIVNSVIVLKCNKLHFWIDSQLVFHELKQNTKWSHNLILLKLYTILIISQVIWDFVVHLICFEIRNQFLKANNNKQREALITIRIICKEV